MAPITANRPVYRDGNHLNEILTHKNVDVIEETKVHNYRWHNYYQQQILKSLHSICTFYTSYTV